MLWMKFRGAKTDSPIWINIDRVQTMLDEPDGCLIEWADGRVVVVGTADAIVHECEQVELSLLRMAHEAPKDEA